MKILNSGVKNWGVYCLGALREVSVFGWAIVLLAAVTVSCESGVVDDGNSRFSQSVGGAFASEKIQQGVWLALGDSDFDSYQANDRKYRVNQAAHNASCVLSPIDVQARDGRDSGASVRNNIFNWREIFNEDAKSGIKELLREARDYLLGRETRLGGDIISELSLRSRGEVASSPALVQINIGINDIDGDDSLYAKFSSMDSHFPWVDARTGALGRVVDNIREIHPRIIIILWQLLDDGGWSDRFTPEQEARITSHTERWNTNLEAIAEHRPGVVVFEANTLTRSWLGRASDGTSKDIVVGGVRYIRGYVPRDASTADVDNTGYVATVDGHANTVLAALYTREIYRLLNDRYGAGIHPFSPVKINTITCQYVQHQKDTPTLEIPPDTVVKHSELPYSLGAITAYDASGNDISDSAVAVSDIDGILYGDGSNIQLRDSRHGVGVHRITVTVVDSNDVTASKSMRIVIE